VTVHGGHDHSQRVLDYQQAKLFGCLCKNYFTSMEENAVTAGVKTAQD
jgi:hypothetical protein